MITLYDVLHVPPTADAVQIKAAYRQQLKRVHPDVGGSDTGVIQLNAAYEVLADPNQRAAYDRTLTSRSSSLTRFDPTMDEYEPTEPRPENPLFGRTARAVIAAAMITSTLLSIIH